MELTPPATSQPFALDLLRYPVVLRTPRRLVAGSNRLEHLPFLMFLVDLLRPDVIVELGVERGAAYCAVCEAVEVLGLDTRCYAVDARLSDEDVLADLRVHHDAFYGGFSQLIERPFDDALGDFPDGSLDLLLIDGARPAEAIQHDIDAWRTKLSARGVVVLHDIHADKRNAGAGHVWQDLRRAHPSFEFSHARGLGVLAVGATPPDDLRGLIALSQRDASALRNTFFRLGHRLRMLARQQLAEPVETEASRLEALESSALAGVDAASQEQRQEARLPRGRGWLTVPFRRLLSLACGLREAWDRAVSDLLPLEDLTPSMTDAGPHPAAIAIGWIGPVRIRARTAGALFIHPPGHVTYQVTIPPRAIFRTLLGLRPEMWGRNPSGVVFSVSVAARDGDSTILRQQWLVDPTNVAADRSWMMVRVDLGRFAGEDVELTLSTSPPAGGSVDFAYALWGDPVIVARQGARELCAAYLRRFTARTVPRRHRPSLDGSRLSLERASRQRLRIFLSDPTATLVFPTWPEPLVSIVIPTFNKAESLYACLESVLAHTGVPFELIVVDDASEDDTPELLARLRNVRWLRNEENLDFIRSCNRGTLEAKGRYLLFLNNDVTVTPRWLSVLVETLERDPRCGAVYGKLVRPDGTLQEAGSIIWRDGSALGYGRGDDPLRPEYRYVREVDFGSAACLLVRAELVRTLGGFDERYLPAYYEDADLCFGVRQLGYTVVFQPRVTVFHAEFGSRTAGRAQALCRANQPKFAEKWAVELERQRPYPEILSARDRRQGLRVLVMDDQVPAPHLGSGFPRAHTMLRLLAEAGFVITFVPLAERTRHQPTTDELEQLGIEVFAGDGFRAEDVLRERAGYYDVVLVSRPHNGALMLPLARRYFPRARIVYDAEALFCLREFKRADLDGQRLSEEDKRTALRQELDIMRDADVVITVSEAERQVIRTHTTHPDVMVWGHAQAVHAPVTPFADRHDLLFVGGFLGEDTPNTRAVVHFTTSLWPAIRQRLADARFVVVGTQPPPSVQALAAPDVEVAGHVADLTEYYERCRVFVAPMQFGAGISLKVIEAMSYGIPTVVSTVGATGLDIEDGREALIAQTDAEFVDKVVTLYADRAGWEAVQAAGQTYVRRRFAPDVMRDNLVAALTGPGDAS